MPPLFASIRRNASIPKSPEQEELERQQRIVRWKQPFAPRSYHLSPKTTSIESWPALERHRLRLQYVTMVSCAMTARIACKALAKRWSPRLNIDNGNYGYDAENRSCWQGHVDRKAMSLNGLWIARFVFIDRTWQDMYRWRVYLFHATSLPRCVKESTVTTCDIKSHICQRYLAVTDDGGVVIHSHVCIVYRHNVASMQVNCERRTLLAFDPETDV